MLEQILNEARQNNEVDISEEYRVCLLTIKENAITNKNRAVLAVCITLLLKKITDPKQDIRLHQAGMTGGFSGRTLDAKTVTPFLSKENFPSMSSGSGWLTRSFEQAHPYNQSYPGKITPKELKQAFLNVINAIEEGGENPKDFLIFLFRSLVTSRENHSTVSLAKPTSMRILDIVDCLSKYWELDKKGAAKLPVLAIYSAYLCLTTEVQKYKNCELLPLLSHTSADAKTGRLGDVDIVADDNTPFEAVEIKHKIQITPQLVAGLEKKIISSGVKTFYLLSTNEKMSQDLNKISNLIMDIRKKYGCQVIINGIGSTLKYYLRLIEDPDKFIDLFVDLVKDDEEISYDLKLAWNDIIDNKDR